jgi:hypothetical protein
MGQHAWLLAATVFTELLIIIKFSRGQFHQPFPTPVKIFFGTGVVLLISYPTIKVRTTSMHACLTNFNFVYPSLVLVSDGIPDIPCQIHQLQGPTESHPPSDFGRCGGFPSIFLVEFCCM